MDYCTVCLVRQSRCHEETALTNAYCSRECQREHYGLGATATLSQDEGLAADVRLGGRPVATHCDLAPLLSVTVPFTSELQLPQPQWAYHLVEPWMQDLDMRTEMRRGPFEDDSVAVTLAPGMQATRAQLMQMLVVLREPEAYKRALETSLGEVRFMARHSDALRVVESVGDLHRFRSTSLMVAYALLNPEVWQAVWQALRDELSRCTVTVTVTSWQEYVARKMRTLVPRRLRLLHRPGYDTVAIGPPPFDDPQWEAMVRAYADNQLQTYDIAQLLRPQYVSFVARDEAGTLLGYVVCTMHHSVETEPQGQIAWLAKEGLPHALHAFIDAGQGLYRVLSIDGLHVDPQWRGGASESLASLLIFHVLYFVQQAAETRVQRVVTFAKARTTAVILRPYGAHYLLGDQAMAWMRERLERGQTIQRDLDNYVQSLDLEAQAGANDEAGTLAALEQLPHDHWLRPMNAMRANVRDHLMDDDLEESSRHSHQWNTFLYTGPENPLFAAQVERYKQLMMPQVELEEAPKRGAEEELVSNVPRKRAKLGRYSTIVLPLDALSQFGDVV